MIYTILTENSCWIAKTYTENESHKEPEGMSAERKKKEKQQGENLNKRVDIEPTRCF